MNYLRWLVLALAPLPIVAACMALSGLMKSGPPTPVAANDVVVRGQTSGERSAPAATARPRQSKPDTDALLKAAEQTAADLSKAIGPECPVIVRPPFVIAGDLTSAELDTWHKQTIEPAARALANCYFKVPPDRPITVLLFSGEDSYNRYALKLFSDEGISIYGYYKPRERTLVMNIGTGGGTLVHELTHALVAFDFPKIPDWFNEGLASLHEQCRFRDGPNGPWIEGLENWRLTGLQQVIRNGRLRSLAELIERDDFRGELEGTNYAQARYFCLYMQQKKVLQTFFHKFRQNQVRDPQGYRTVGDIFPNVTWAELDKDFQAWVMTLKQ